MEFVIVNAPGVCSWSPRIRAYDGLVRGELEYAMSGDSSPQPSPHRIAILMSPAGRFLMCRDCKLSFQFPDGVPYGQLAKQFESHLCLSPTPTSGWRSDRGFVIVRYVGTVPVMASCARCHCKFFTPSSTFARDPVGAEEYLGRKFDVHECEESKR
jgi:hypothetical protein